MCYLFKLTILTSLQSDQFTRGHYSNYGYKLLLKGFKAYMSRDMTKQIKWACAQRRLRSAWASAQSDQSLRRPHEESLGP